MGEEEREVRKEVWRVRGELGEGMELWEECYKRFKPEFDRLARSDKEIKELRAKLEAQEGVFRVNLRREKNRILVITLVFALATIAFLGIVFSGRNHVIYFIAGLLIMAGLGLFLFTSAAGRVWCGYACPQTVWTDLYILVERWVEGDRNARLRLHRQKWDMEKIRKRLIKWSLWLIIGAATGGAWVF